jgi:hypothetical protein
MALTIVRDLQVSPSRIHLPNQIALSVLVRENEHPVQRTFTVRLAMDHDVWFTDVYSRERVKTLTSVCEVPTTVTSIVFTAGIEGDAMGRAALPIWLESDGTVLATCVLELGGADVYGPSRVPKPRPSMEESARVSPALAATNVAAVCSRTLTPGPATVLRTYLYSAAETADVIQDADVFMPAASREMAGDLSTVPIKRGTAVTVMVYGKGVDVQPPQRQFVWLGQWQKTDFEIRAMGVTAASQTAITASWFVSGICVAQATLAVTMAAQWSRDNARAFSAAAGYASVFVSYSHKDREIVDVLDAAYTALGMSYLRDVTALRSGEKWNDRLLQLIDQANLFQLCWSTNAVSSTYVKQEYQHALRRAVDGFVRPVYWEEPMPPAPPELAEFHFARLNLFPRTR